MSRPLVLAALALFAVAGLAPLAAMALRVDASDLAALGDPRTASLLGRTLALGLGAAGIALALGLPFGFLVARTDLPGAGALRALGVVPLLLPPLFLAMAWAVVAPELRGATATILVLGVANFPLVGVLSARAFERVDGRVEEAARLAGGLPAVLRMELPLVLPAAACGACFAFAFAVNDFGVPDYVSSVGPKFNVYADEVFLQWSQTQRPGGPVAAALPLVALTLAALAPALALRRRGAMASLGGDFRRPGTLPLGAWRWPALAFALAVVALGALVPLGRLLWEAAEMPTHLAGEAGTGAALAAGGESLRESFGLALERSRADLRNSLVFAALAGLACAPVGLVLGHAAERGGRSGRALELVSVLPLAAPAILFAIGTIALWNREALAAVYDGPAMAVVLLAGRYAPFAILVASGAVASLDPRLEEAAALAGARPARRMAAVVAPALRGAVVAGFLLVFVFAMRDLDAAILVPSANKTAIFRVYNGVHFGRDAYVAALALLLVAAILLPGLLWTLFARKRLEVLP